MLRVNRRLSLVALFVPASLLLASGCATKAYVDSRVNPVETRVSALEKKEAEDIIDVKERIQGVDDRAKRGINDAQTAAGAAQTAAQTAANDAAVANTAAKNAQASATTADQHAGTAQTAATGAQNTATAAQGAATDARGRADNAQGSANQAQTGVNQVREDLAALQQRVAGINVNPTTGAAGAPNINIDTIDNYEQSGPLRNVNFAFDSATLSADAKKTLDALADEVKGLKSGFMMELTGYTDSIGTEQYNIDLSERRVLNVQRYLVSKGVTLSRLSNIGLGKDNPVADNKTSAGQAENRRVSIRLLRAQSNTPTR